MFTKSYFQGYENYKYDEKRAWILEQTLDSYWSRNSGLKDYRMKQYTKYTDDDKEILNQRSMIIRQNDVDILKDFQSQCLDYVNIPSMSHYFTQSTYSSSNNLWMQVLLNIYRALDIREQIAINRSCQSAMKQNQNQRILAEKNNISDSELNDISSIVEIGIKSNYAMLNAIYNNKAMSNTANAKATMLKILNVLS